MIQPVYSVRPPKHLVLHLDYHIDLAEIGIHRKVDVPHDFIWDGASIPRVFWLTIGGPYHPKFTVAGLVHDYLYKTQVCTRKEADLIFYRLLRFHDVGYITAKRMYFGVRTGGIIAWNRHKKNLKNQ